MKGKIKKYVTPEEEILNLIEKIRQNLWKKSFYLTRKKKTYGNFKN